MLGLYTFLAKMIHPVSPITWLKKRASDRSNNSDATTVECVQKDF